MNWGGGAANRWNNRGSGKGGGKGKTPWSFFHVVDDADSLGLMALSEKIPDTWIDWQHGGRRSRERMHSTLLLKMKETGHHARLQKLAQEAAPMTITIGELFCERVDRISDAEVYCIGVALACPELRALKDAWTSEEAVERRKIHVPYDSEGHISIAYIRGECQASAQGFVMDHADRIMGHGSFTLNHVIYQDEWGKDNRVSLGSPEGKGTKRPRSSGSSDGCPLEIDGSVLEGGGQILRMSSAYSALFMQPIHITKIRAGRSKPGLAAQHLESLRLVRDVSRATLSNDYLGSCEVTLTPTPLSGGSFSADPGTAGAITLMVQASLFPLLYAGGSCECDLRGGTDVSFSPPLDFLCRVLRPTLSRMGANFSVECLERGFFPRGGGRVRLNVPRLAAPLRPVDLADKGEVLRAEAILYATKQLGGDECSAVSSVRQTLGQLAPEVKTEFSLAPGPERAFKYWVDIVVETTTGAIFHGGSEPKDLPWPGKGGGKGGGNLSQLFVAAAQAALVPLRKELATGAAVDTHLCDQLILPASLAAGTSRWLAGELSMHTQTAIHIAELFVPGVKFKKEQRGTLTLIEVEGIGHTPTAGFPSASAAVVPPPRRSAEPAPKTMLDEDVVQLADGALKRASKELLSDIQNDMHHIEETYGVKIVLDAQNNRLVLNGPAEKRSAVREELKPVLEFYFGAK